MAANQQPVGIDTIGSAGDEGAIIPALFDIEVLKLVWKDCTDLIDLIGEGFVKYAYHKSIAVVKQIEVAEELCTGQSAVSGEDAVGRFTADREGTALDMTDGDLED